MLPSTNTGFGTDEVQRVTWTAERNLVYRDADPQSGQPANLACLDVFFSREQRQKRVIVYVHGGHWMGGDKSEIEDYPRLLDFLIGHGCVVATVNFSLIRKGKAQAVTYEDQARDIAAALKWLTLHVEEYGGRSEGFMLLGYSSGAHLAALVALDERYLESQGLNGALVRSVIAMDVHAYDIPAALTLMMGTSLEANIPLMTSLFGESRQEQEAASPVNYVSNAGRKLFLLFSCALSGRLPQPVTRTISESLKDKLIAHGHKALHEHLAHHDHRSILSRFGTRHDGVLEKIKVFLDIEAATHWALQDGLENPPQLQPSSRDLRLEAVLRAETGDRPAAEIAREFGVSVDELYAWKKEFKKSGKMSASLRGGKRRRGAPVKPAAPLTLDEAISEEHKREAVRLVEIGDCPAAEIAREFGMRVDELYAWKKKFRKRGKTSKASSGEKRPSGPLTGGTEPQPGAGEISEERKLEAVHLLEIGDLTAAQIARELGVGVGELYAWKKKLKKRRKAGKSSNGEKRGTAPLASGTEPQAGEEEISEERKLEAVRLVEIGDLPVAQIARELGVGVGELYAWKKSFKRRNRASKSSSGEKRGTGPLASGTGPGVGEGEISEERKLEAVRFLEAGDWPAAQIARELGVRVDQLYAWKKKFKKRGKASKSSSGENTETAPPTSGTALRSGEGEISEEKKLEAVRLVETGDRPAADIARELGVRVGELYAWKKKFRKRGKASKSSSGGKREAGPLTSGTEPNPVGAQISEEIKREAVRLAETSGRPAAQIARELGVRIDELYAWKNEFKKRGEMFAPPSGGASRPGPFTGGTEPRAGEAEVSEEIRREAVRLAETSGRPAAQIAREFGVRIDQIYAWKKEFKKRGEVIAPPSGGTSQPDPLTTDPRSAEAEFSEEFKREAVRLLVSSGKPASLIARELKIPVNNLYQWKKKFSDAA